MKILSTLLLIALLGFIAGLYLPWWSVAVVAFFSALLVQPGVWQGFVAGFAGVFLMWAVVAFWIDAANHSLLSQKIAQLLPLQGSSILLIIVTAFIGGLVGGFAAMAGSSLHFNFKKNAV